MLNKLTFSFIFYTIFILCFGQDYWETIYSYDESIHQIEEGADNILFMTNFEGLNKSYNNGASWESALEEYAGIFFLDSHNNIYTPNYFSANNGDDWEEIVNCDTFGINRIFVNSQNSIFLGFWGGITKLNQNSTSWNVVLSFSNTEVIKSIIENSEGILFAATTNYLGGGGVYRSIDNGETWEHIGLDFNYMSSLAVNSNDELFAGCRGHHTDYVGRVYKSMDNGETWNEVFSGSYITSIVIDSNNLIFISGTFQQFYPGGIWSSSDNGDTWEFIESNLVNNRAKIEYLYISDDNYLYAIDDRNPKQIYRSIEPTGVVSNAPEFVKPTYELRNYPNPFNISNSSRSIGTAINFSGKQNLKNPKVEIYNVKGQLVKTISNIKQQNGNFAIEWNGKNNNQKQVSSGVYLYRVTSDGFESKFNKMIILK